MGKIADALDKAGKASVTEKTGVINSSPEDERSEAREGAASPAPQGTDHQRRGGCVSLPAGQTQNSVSPRLVVYHHPGSPAAENFKVLRSHLLYPRDGQEKRVVLITSALEQEGKTFVACNLAVSIAQGIDPYALLIDADTRNPHAHEMLGIQAQEGLSDYLQSGNSLARFLVKTPLTKLTVLPAGPTPRNPAELLTSSRMSSMLAEARERYSDRFIILDSPPVNLAAETLTLAKHVDTVILVVRYGKSFQDVVEQAVEKIGRERILGVVFNGFEVTPRKYSYYKRCYRYPE